MKGKRNQLEVALEKHSFRFEDESIRFNWARRIDYNRFPHHYRHSAALQSVRSFATRQGSERKPRDLLTVPAIERNAPRGAIRMRLSTAMGGSVAE